MTNLNSKRIITAAICCGIAGFLGFLVQEPSNRASEQANTPGSAEAILAESMVSFGLLGLLIGAGLVLADEMGATSGKRIGTRLVLGAGAGAICGAAGGFVGQLIYSAMLQSGGVNIVSVVIARTIGWAAVGAGTGLSSGLASSNGRKARQGALGGAVGGAIGGILFDLIAAVVGSGTGSRMIGDTAIGAFVGGFAVAVEEMAKAAWITVVAGRNEGKQYILSKPSTTIGRDELADIPLYGDHNVARQHAVVQNVGGRDFICSDAGSPSGTLFNGVRSSGKTLVDGDRLQIGQFTLMFNLKASAGTVPSVPGVPGAVSVPPPANQAVCQFCGGPRDPYTGQCACSPVGAAVAVASGQAGLQGISGPYTGRSFTLSVPATRIGRDASNNVVLDADGGVSRQHAVITSENGTYNIQDNNSSNGTYVNGYRVQRVGLNSGDVIHIGSSDFRFTV